MWLIQFLQYFALFSIPFHFIAFFYLFFVSFPFSLIGFVFRIMFAPLLVTLLTAVLNAPNIHCQYTKADNCSVDVFDNKFAAAYGHFGIDSLPLPNSQSKLRQYCKAVADNKVFSKDFGERCLTGTSQTLLNLQVYNVDRVNKPYCAKNGKKKVCLGFTSFWFLSI